jgi:hypothetical protein
MWQPWPPPSKKGFWDLLPGKNPPKSLFLKPNPLVDAMIAQVSNKLSTNRTGMVIFPNNLGLPTPQTLYTFTMIEFKNSYPAPPDNGAIAE